MYHSVFKYIIPIHSFCFIHTFLISVSIFILFFLNCQIVFKFNFSFPLIKGLHIYCRKYTVFMDLPPYTNVKFQKSCHHKWYISFIVLPWYKWTIFYEPLKNEESQLSTFNFPSGVCSLQMPRLFLFLTIFP